MMEINAHCINYYLKFRAENLKSILKLLCSYKSIKTWGRITLNCKIVSIVCFIFYSVAFTIMMNVKSPKKLEFIVNPVATTNVLKLEWFQNGKILKMNMMNLAMKWEMKVLKNHWFPSNIFPDHQTSIHNFLKLHWCVSSFFL